VAVLFFGNLSNLFLGGE